MHNIYKLILIFLAIVSFGRDGGLYGQCDSLLCQRLNVTLNTGTASGSNLLSNTGTICYDSLAFIGMNPLFNIVGSVGDTLILTTPNIPANTTLNSINWNVRIGNSANTINESTNTLKIPINSTFFPACSQVLRVKYSATTLCNGVLSELKGVIAFRLNLKPAISYAINNVPTRMNGELSGNNNNNPTIININSGDFLSFTESSPLSGTNYSYSINSAATVSQNTLNINQSFPIGSHSFSLTVTQPSSGCFTYVYKATINVANSCAIDYKGNTYNQLANNPSLVSTVAMQGDSLVFTSQGTSSTHLWTFELRNPITNSIVSTTTQTTATAIFHTNTLLPCNYLLKVKYNGNNCGATEYGVDVDLMVNPQIFVNNITNPIPLSGNYSLSSCSGGNTFSLSATNIPGATYSWDLNGQITVAPTLTNITVSPPSTINGILVITPVANSICSDSTPYSRNFQIQSVANTGGYRAIHGSTTNTITQTGNQNITMCEGDTLVLESLLDGNYIWNTWSATLDTTKRVTFNNLQSGVYSGRFTYTSTMSGCTGQQTFDFTVTVNAKPNGYTIVSSKGQLNTTTKLLEVCAGTDSIRLTVNCPNSTCPISGSDYVWNYGSISKTGQVISENAPIDTLRYIIRMTNSVGCSSYDTLTLKSRVLPMPNINSNNYQVCSGDRITLNTTYADTTTRIRSYMWSGDTITGGATNLQITNLQQVYAFPENNTVNNTDIHLVYNVVVTDYFGCSAQDSIHILVKPVWKGQLTSNRISDLCESDTLKLTANCQNCITNTPVTYSWYLNNISGNHTIASANIIDSINILASDIKALTPSNFLVVLNAVMNGCTTVMNGVARQNIWANPDVILDTILNGAGLCINNIITAEAIPVAATTGSSYNYQWTGGMATIQANQQNYILVDPTVMKVKVFYNPVPQITCFSEATKTVTVSSINNFTISATDTIVCSGDSVTLSSSLVQTNAHYAWYNNTTSTLIPGADSSSLSINPTVTTEYRLDITTQDGCHLSTTQEVRVAYAPTVTLLQPQEPLCAGQTIVVSALASGGNGRYSYVWSGGTSNDSLPPVSSSSTATEIPNRRIVTVPPTTQPHSLEVTVTDLDNTTCTATKQILILPLGCTEEKLLINRSLNKEKYCENDTVRVVAEVKDSTMLNPIFYWSTGRVRNSTSGNTKDTLVLTGSMNLADTMVSVIVTNGEPDFKVKELMLSNDSSKIVTINDNTADFTGSNNESLVLHPSLLLNPNTNNNLFNKSQLKITIFKLNVTNATLETLSEVLFDSKYAGRIISQTPRSNTDTLFLDILVQVPCMLATNAVPIMLVTPTGQLKRIPNSVRILNSLPAAPAIMPQAIRTERVAGGANDSLNTSVNNVRDTVSAKITGVASRQNGMNFPNNIRFSVTIKARADDHNSGNGGVLGNNRDYKLIVTKVGSQKIDSVEFEYDLRTKDTTINFNIPSSANLSFSDFPLIVRLERKSGSNFISVDVHTDKSGEGATVLTDAAQINIKTYGTLQYFRGIYNLTPTPATDQEIDIANSSITSNISFTTNRPSTSSAVADNRKYYTISIPSPITAVTTAIDSLNNISFKATDTISRDIWTGSISHTNTNRTTNNSQKLTITIPKDSTYTGRTSNTLYGPMIVTHMSFSDYVFNKAVNANDNYRTTPSEYLVDVLIDTTLTGKAGHVCLFEMGTITNPDNYVYISSSNRVIDGKAQQGSSNTREQAFKFIVEKPSIDTVKASLDTVCSEELTVLTAVAAQMPDASYTWSARPALSTADAAMLASMNLDSVYIRPKRTAMYKVKAISKYGCKAEDSILITVNSLPYSNIYALNSEPATSTSPKTVKFCENSSVTLFARADSISCGGNCHYDWEKLDAITWSDIGTSEYVNRNNEELIRLSISINGCFDYDTIRLVKHTPPIVNLNTTQSMLYMCDGAPINIAVDSPDVTANYRWNNGVTYPSLDVVAQGGYYVEITDANGCTAQSRPVLVTNSTIGKNSIVSGNPTIICGNTPASLQVTPCQNCTYTWYKQDATNAIVVRSQSPNRFYTATVEGIYYAKVKNEQGCEFLSTNQITVTSSSIIIPNIVSSSTYFCDNSVITITGPSLANYTYKWYHNNIIMSAHTTSTITVSEAGEYKLQIMLGNSCTSMSNIIPIKDTLFAPILDVSESIICDGSYLTLSTPLIIGAQYQWYLNGVALANAIGSTYDATIAGNYYVRVTNPNGCSANTNTRTLNVSTVSSPVASSDVTNFCPGDSVRLAVTLCPGCQYQWLKNGIEVSTVRSSGNYVYYAKEVGAYNVRVYDQYGTCNVLSNTIVLNQNNAPIPSIATTIREICNNIYPILQTTSCIGCTYTWTQNVSINATTSTFQPIFGAPNDTLYTVSDSGAYQVMVKYPNGCQVSSTTLQVNDGSFNISITLDSTSGFSSQICNGSAIRLQATLSDPTRCTGNCSYQWFRGGALLATTALPYYEPIANQRLAGNYQVRVTTAGGCIAESQAVYVPSIVLAPTIAASASALCGNTPVILSIGNCPNNDCSTATIAWSSGANTPTISVNNQSSYTATVTLSNFHCSAVTPPIALNSLSGLGTRITFASGTNSIIDTATASICEGTNVQMVRTNICSTCTYQWVKDTLGNPHTQVLTATLPNLSTNVSGRYALIARDPNNNCRDTSNYLVLNRVNRDPDLLLKFSPNNVLAATGSPVNLDNLGDGLTPASLHTIGSYTSTPLFAYTPNNTINPGLNSNSRRDIFNPSNALSGNYLITYTYPLNGCNFSTSDILTIKDGASVTITNRNPSHVSYEACVTDTIVISTTNYPFTIDTVYLLDQQDVYQNISIVGSSQTIDNLGTDWVYNQNVTIVIPSWAKGSFIRLAGYRSNGNHETATTPYLMIHNEPLSITGLPEIICSNGNQIAISGSPVGGIFTMLPSSSDPLVDSVGIFGVFNGNILNPTVITQSYYNNEGVADLKVAYRSYSKFTNGLNCPQPDIVTKSVEARAVTLNNVTFLPISVSQQREELVKLIDKVTPYTSSPSRWLVNSVMNGHTIGFGGGYTTPAGAPTHFLASNAGIGAHIIQYSIANGTCQNTVNNILQVLPAPTAVALNDTICRNINPVSFARDAAYQYSVPNPAFFQGVVAYRDTNYVMRVTTAETNRYITTVNPNIGLEQFRYTPRDNGPAAQIIDDSLLIEYIFKRKEYNIVNGSYSIYDSTSYVVASFKVKLHIEDTLPVMIRDTASRILCEENRDILLGATPMGGVFTLKGGNGIYANETVLTNNILNTYNVHHAEAGTTNYVLSYAFNGVACRSTDTFAFSIPSPLNASFVIPNNIIEYCHSAAPVTLLPATTTAASTTLLVNGVAQQGVVFTPSLTQPGLQTLELRLSDANGCETRHSEVVTVHPLPQLDMRNFVNTMFCTNDEPFSFTITPSPTCIGATGGELIQEDFASTILPTGWRITNNNPAASSWAQYAYPGTNGVVYIDTTSKIQDAWIFTRPIPMQSGTTYQLEYLMRVGDDCPACDPAAMEIKVGVANTPAGQDIVLGTYPELDNNYAGFFDWHTNTFIAPASGNYYFSFHANAKPTASNRIVRSIAMDQIIVRQITPTNCATGIGSLSGSGIVATSGNDSVYTFVPSSAHLGVDTIRYVFADMNGCIDSIVKPIEISQHPLITMTSLDSTYCWNEQPIPLQGTPVGGVFSIRRLDTNTGSNLQMNGNTVNNITYNTSVPLVFLPHMIGTEEVNYTYRDPLSQCATTVRDTVIVISIPDSVRFLTRDNAPTNNSALDSLYCEYVNPITLYVQSVRGSNITNGTFFGPGVLNGTGGHGAAQLSPSTAVTDMGHVGYDTLSYVYTASNGCVDTTRQVVRIEPRPTLSFTHNDPTYMLPDSICENADSLLILVRHTQYTIDPVTRELTYIDSLLRHGVGNMESLPTGLLVLGDSLKPHLFGPGTFIMNYSYTNDFGCSNTISKSFRVDPVPTITFDRLPVDRNYCENEEGNFIYAYPSYYPGSGYLQLSSSSGTQTINSSFTYIDPASMANPTQSVTYDLYYEYTSHQGCIAHGTDVVHINPYPRIDISSLPTTFCSALDSVDLYNFVQPQTGIFTDNLHVPSIVSGHYLNLYGAPGPRRILYHVQDPITACSNVDSQLVTLYTMPLPSFETFGGCQQDSIRFTGAVTLDPAFDNITSVSWRYGDGQEDIILVNPSNPMAIPEGLHFYSTHGYFVPTLTVVNNSVCSTTVSREIVISQAVTINDLTGPYSQNFETNAIGWYPQDENVAIGASSIWSNTQLLHNNIVDNQNTAWVTYADATNGVYGHNVRSYLYTPCFDMTETWKPMVSMDLWLDFVNNIDGATFEYYDRTIQAWKVLGEHDNEIGINWYNSDFVAAQPGIYRNMSSILPQGWTGQDWRAEDGSRWMNTRYRLDQFAGHDNVQFRIAFATSPNTMQFTNPQGMALDNFWIGERTRNILVEHFSYFNMQNIDEIDSTMHSKVYNNNYGRDVHLIQYNLENNQGVGPRDSLYIKSMTGVNARSSRYGNLKTPNRFLMNGAFRDDSISHNMRPEIFEQAMLMTPKYIIYQPKYTIVGNQMKLVVDFIGNTGSAYENVDLFIAITEDSVQSQNTSFLAQRYNVNSAFRYIYRGSGMNISGPNWYGRPYTTDTLLIDLAALPISDTNRINIVAFIQDNLTKEVYQVNATKNTRIYLYDGSYPTVPTGVNEIIDETSTMKLYPNPTTALFTVDFSNALETNHEWILVDMLGRVLKEGKAPIGTSQMQVETDDLPSGNYVFVIQNGTILTQRQVIVVRP